MRFITLIFIMIAFSACSHKTPKKQPLTKPAQAQITKTSLLKAPPAYNASPTNPTQETTTLERELENRRIKEATGIDMGEHSPLNEVLDAVLDAP